jgi:hypothetical protein
MVFYFSSFLPASHFAWMMLLLLAIAVVGDLVLLPALVIGPAGKLFERQYPKSRPSPEGLPIGDVAAPATHIPSHRSAA